VKELLRTAVRHHRLAHAYLFWGNEGVGKDAAAIAFAKTLLCERQEEEFCGECSSCRKMDLLQHPNVSLVIPLPGGDAEKSEDEGKLENDVMEEVRRQISQKAADPYFHIAIPKARFIRIPTIRSIKKESSLSNAESGKKIILIFDADAMNDAAANSLLKILEEPLDGVHFILTTSRKDQLKPTIISRCQLLQFSSLHDEEISAALIERERVSETDAHFIARLANGNYRQALQMLHDGVTNYRTDAVKFLRSLLGNSAIKLLDEQEEYIFTNKREEVEELLLMLLVWFRDAFVMNEQSAELMLNIDQQSDLSSFVSKFGHQRIEECLDAVEKALELLRRNVYLPLVMISLTVHLRRILNAKKV
jgi:DNA polymerase-3 subunit delta'